MMLLFSEIRSNLKNSTTQADIQMLGNSMYMENMLTMLTCTIIAVIIVILVVRNVTKPVFRLMESVRGGVEGIHSFEESGIREIDELHDVIENLTDTQKLTQNQLLEEKERYRIAVESSQDLFFTYKRKEQSLEIVNSNGHEAVTAMVASQPGYYDLILMDIMMPVMNGLEATRKIRQLSREDCQRIPIIAMSANAFDEDVKRSLASGMNAHLSKPVNVEKLIETLETSFRMGACD